MINDKNKEFIDKENEESINDKNKEFIDKENEESINDKNKEFIDKENEESINDKNKEFIDKENEESINDKNKEFIDKENEESILKMQLNIIQKKYHDNILRMHAEIDNINNRNKKEIEKIKKFSLEKIISELLLVIDNLERALETTKKSCFNCKITIQGIDLTLKSMINSVNKFGLKVIDKINIPFDPNIHQAITITHNKLFKKNYIINIIQKGYMLNGRLIRPAMVIVSKN
ncbi:nucleotide exchange factor GrpE [Sodalis-like secondary symbiont of Drepanosiphum platanoidis]|uniref:nucleotide exchange factor GrpE n=1 Tax=Sodalis-like secondary symbiont of Drepanosiphum platanoidis TaxID=2994493 RepID=UPI0034640212